jgi:hypothetical protein
MVVIYQRYVVLYQTTLVCALCSLVRLADLTTGIVVMIDWLTLRSTDITAGGTQQLWLQNGNWGSSIYLCQLPLYLCTAGGVVCKPRP